MRTHLDFQLDDLQRLAQLRRIGRDLHDQAAALSRETVDAMAAVISRLSRSTDYGQVLEKGFAEAMVTESEVRHLSTFAPGQAAQRTEAAD